MYVHVPSSLNHCVLVTFSVMPLLRESVLTNSIDPLRKCFQLPEDQLSTLAALSPVSEGV